MRNALKDVRDRNQRAVGDIVGDLQVCMVTTYHGRRLRSCPMTVLEVDTTGHLWFFTSNKTEMMLDLHQHPDVNLTFCDVKSNRYLSIAGVGVEVDDRAKMRELWDPAFTTWYKEGLDTPGIALMKVSMQEIEFWDAPSSAVKKFAGFMKAIAGDDSPKPGRHEKVNARQ